MLPLLGGEAYHKERQHRSKNSWHVARICAIAEETGDKMLLPRTALCLIHKGLSSAAIFLKNSDMLTALCNENVSLEEKQGHAHMGCCGPWLEGATTQPRLARTLPSP